MEPFVVSQELLATVQGIHAPATSQVNVKPIVQLIESIFYHNADGASQCAAYATSSDIICSPENSDGMRQALHDIRSVSFEMSCNLSKSINATTMVVLEKLKSYSWNAKVVIAIASIASKIGEVLLLDNLRTTDPIAKSLDLFKGQQLKLDSVVLNNLLKAMMDVVKTNLAFLVPPISKIPEWAPSRKDAMGYFPIATYKILRIVVQIASILSKRSEENIDSPIRCLANEVSNIHIVLQEKLEGCRWEIAKQTAGCQCYEAAAQCKCHEVRCRSAEKRKWCQCQEAVQFQTLDQQSVWCQCHEVVQCDQYEDFGELIPQISTWELINKIKHNIMKIQVPEKLRNKHVLFLISDLDISIEEIMVLNGLYLKNNQRYEVVWLPMVDVSIYDRAKFSCLKQLMTWGTVNPCKIGPVVTEFIKKEWNFVKAPIAVSLNGEGEVTCQNALPMLWKWGNLAFPFTDTRENDLWSDINEGTGWRLNLLVDENIVPDILSWSGSFVCLFGGENISWMRDLTEKVRMATCAAGVYSPKLVYVGKNKSKGIARNELSCEICVLESENRWQFWTRLESILYAKMRQGKSSKTDCVMQEALKVLGYASNGDTWAMFSMGSAAMVTTNGEMALNIMSNYGDWKTNTTYAGPCFFEALRNYYTMIQSRNVHLHRCANVHLPILGQNPGIAICPECCKEMEICYTYRCKSL